MSSPLTILPLPPPSFPPPTPPPNLVAVVNTVAVSAADLADTSPAEFGAALVAALGEQLSTETSEDIVSMVVMVSESVEMDVESGTFEVNSGFAAAVQAAACTGMVGTCDVSLVDRRQLGASSHATLLLEASRGGGGSRLSSSSHVGSGASVAGARRRLGTTLAVSREYDYGASASSSSSVSELVEGSLGDMGVAVTSSTTTSLSAESTVTALNDEESGDVAAQLDTGQLAGALALRLPSVSLDVTTLVITPPVAPPLLPPSPPPAPPSMPPPSPSRPGVDAIVALTVTTSLLAVLVLIAVVSMVILRRRRTNRKRVLPYPKGGHGGKLPAQSDEPAAAPAIAPPAIAPPRQADAATRATCWTPPEAQNGGSDAQPVASDLVSRTEQLASRVYQAREEVRSLQISTHDAAAQRLQKALSPRSDISPRATFVAGPLSPFSTSSAKYSLQNVGDSSGHRGGEQLQATRAEASLDKQCSAHDVEPVSEPMAVSGPQSPFSPMQVGPLSSYTPASPASTPRRVLPHAASRTELQTDLASPPSRMSGQPEEEASNMIQARIEAARQHLEAARARTTLARTATMSARQKLEMAQQRALDDWGEDDK